jgi:Protein of unknown function (DUF1549)/Protein of unknown function (DUF1553)
MVMRKPVQWMAAAVVIAFSGTAFAVDSDCPYGKTTPARQREGTIRQLSITAEAVAGSGRKRAVTKPPGGPAPRLQVVNFIDAHIDGRQHADGIAPTVVSGDEEFLRRISLDLAGVIPTAAEVEAFVADTSADKRAKKIDELLTSDGFTDRWTMWFGDLVQNVQFANNSVEYYVGRNAYYNWIKDSMRAGKPYDQMVREAVAGKGDNFAVGVANYVVRQIQNNGPIQDTYDNLAAHAGEKFLGMPLLCVSCHGGAGHLELVNWYLRNKTREDFWRMAAFFSRTQSRGVRATDPANPNIMLFKFDVTDNATGNYRLNTRDGNKSPRQPAAGQPTSVDPAFLTTGARPNAGEPYREAFGRMLTADRQFARATVNYLWKEMFGLGLVEPVNSFDLAKLDSQPLDPGLLEALTDEFIAQGYSLRAILRTMAMSSTYQLSATYTPGLWNEAWVPYFARRYPRRLMAEAAVDSVARATGVGFSMNVQGLGGVTKAMSLPDPTEGGRGANQPGLLLDQFGRGDRDETARTGDSSITQALTLMNSQFVVSRVRRSNAASTVASVLRLSQDPAVIADRLYLSTLSRKPTAEERQKAIDYLRGGTLGDRAEDLQFVLLNSLEFIFN